MPPPSLFRWIHQNRFTRPRRRVGTRMLAAGEQLESRRLLAFDPSPLEQAFMENINRMRLDPQGELDVIFTNDTAPLRAREASVQAALDFFGVDSNSIAQSME